MQKLNVPPVVKVGILSDECIEFGLYGDYKVDGFNETFNGVIYAELKDNIIICSIGKKTIEISDEIQFDPSNQKVDYFLFNDIKVGEKYHWENKEKERFRGSLYLKKHEGKIIVINLVNIEDYLRGVISSEMSDKSTLQALKAHSVISRSWLLSQMYSKNQKENKNEHVVENENATEHITWTKRQEHQLYDVCASDHCQRYHGITRLSTGMALRAVNETEGIVLTYQNEICDTRYSKCCGGITESFENVWEPEKIDYLTSMNDYKFEPENYSLDFSNEESSKKWIINTPPAFCNTMDKNILSNILIDYDQKTQDCYRWEVKYNQKTLAKIIKEKTTIDFGDIIDLIPVERGASSRLITLKIIGSKKTLIIGKELEIRRILSSTHLYSSAIVIEKQKIKDGIPQKFIIKGAGWGHGVGLCQIGAAVMSAEGYKFDEILSHYFSRTTFKKIY
ncbi:MAG: SpoIID/LytB domain-containing protein [Bacteroidetes bacterium]|nr:SpoIID/LytB domain-containing protein [Bacteroidota bacterium]